MTIRPKRKSRRRKTSLATMRKEAYDAFESKAGPISDDARKALDEMFDMTLGRFKKSASRRAPTVDLWTTKNGKFRAFILREARKIGTAAARGSGRVTGARITRAGVNVMLATNANCEVAIQGGKLILNSLQGSVCSGFLEQNAGI